MVSYRKSARLRLKVNRMLAKQLSVKTIAIALVMSVCMTPYSHPVQQNFVKESFR